MCPHLMWLSLPGINAVIYKMQYSLTWHLENNLYDAVFFAPVFIKRLFKS